jgi:magnesium transporter
MRIAKFPIERDDKSPPNAGIQCMGRHSMPFVASADVWMHAEATGTILADNQQRSRMSAMSVETIRSQAAASDSKLSGSRVKGILFDAGGSDRVIEQFDIAHFAPGNDRQLLWIDITQPDRETLLRIAAPLGVPHEAIDAVLSQKTDPMLSNGGDFFWLRVVGVEDTHGLSYSGGVLHVIACANLVLTCHSGPISFLDCIRARESGETELGRLSAASFTASILDWQLATYFDAAAKFEIAVERLEVQLLSEVHRDCLVELRVLRKAASRLRRMLAPHRIVFAGLSRPDFRPQEDGAADRHFLAIDGRFERAMDIVENARELVIGSFELFSSRNTLATNDQMRTLTFVTVVIGGLAVLAGVLGMNFDAPFFNSAATGFWTAVSAMGVLVAISIWMAKWRRWI